jgi:DNA-binding beta-propeller fold protein YncE
MTGPSAAALSKPRDIALIEEFRVSGDTGTNEFTFIVGIGVSDNGQTYVLDQQTSTVRIYDATGRELDRFGAPGAGPGELQRPDRMVLANDTVFIIDQQGLHRFTGSGVFIGRVAVDTRVSVGRSTVTRYPQSLAYTTKGLVTSLNLRAGPRARIFRDTAALFMLDPVTGKLSESVALVISAELYTIARGITSPAKFARRPSYIATRDAHVLVTTSDGRHIDVLSLTGEPPVRIRFETPHTPVTPADVKALISASEQSPPGPPFSTRAYVAGIRRLPRAEYHAVVGRLVAGDDGELLVERPDLGTRVPYPPSPTTWDLLKGNDDLVGRIVLPARFTPIVLKDNAVTGVSTDSLDVPSVVRYRLRI